MSFSLFLYTHTIVEVEASAQVKFRCYLFNPNGFLLFINDVEQEQRKSFGRGENEAQ